MDVLYIIQEYISQGMEYVPLRSRLLIEKDFIESFYVILTSKNFKFEKSIVQITTLILANINAGSDESAKFVFKYNDLPLIMFGFLNNDDLKVVEHVLFCFCNMMCSSDQNFLDILKK